MDFKSKLPKLGTSIFTQMSMLANKHHAINLSQGFPGFDTPEFLKEATIQAISNGMNQYSPANGQSQLQHQIASLVARNYSHKLDPDKEVTVTSGATEGLWCAIQTLVSRGDEVIVFDPAYDSYAPAVELAGGQCRHIELLAPSFNIDWDRVAQAINHKTRAIIINSPHNPTGSILSATDLQILQKLVLEHELYVISDEVYEFITFDQNRHESVHLYPELYARSFIISSFGKTFHCTGWKIGYVCAPEVLSKEFRKVHQYVTFCSFSPAQIGLAQMLSQHPEHIEFLPNFYQAKRDLVLEHLQNSRFGLLQSYGTYFQLLDYSLISDLNDVEFCRWLTIKQGIAAIPLSPFYQRGAEHKLIRLCFAKQDATLMAAAEKLKSL
ncbi:methionine aminotransferase [Aliikangiella sp. IMCC44632]